MANEVASLVVRIGATTTDLAQGLDAANGYLRQFARVAETALTPPANIVDDAATVLNKVKGKYQEVFNTLREQLQRGVIDRARFAADMEEAGKAGSAALLAGLSTLRSRGILPEGIRTDFLAQMEQMGRQGGQLLSAGAATGFSSMQSRAVRTGVSVGLAFEAMANGAESGMRRAVRAVELLAVSFGPEGILVAGIITGGLAIYDFFNKARLEAEKTRRKFETEIAALQKAGKGLSLQAQVADIDQQAAQLGTRLNAARAQLNKVKKAEPVQLLDAGEISVPNDIMVGAARKLQAQIEADTKKLGVLAVNRVKVLQAIQNGKSFPGGAVTSGQVSEDVQFLEDQRILKNAGGIRAATAKLLQDRAELLSAIQSTGGFATNASREAVHALTELDRALKPEKAPRAPTITPVERIQRADTGTTVDLLRLAEAGLGNVQARLQDAIAVRDRLVGQAATLEAAGDHTVAGAERLRDTYNQILSLTGAINAVQRKSDKQPVDDLHNMATDVVESSRLGGVASEEMATKVLAVAEALGTYQDQVAGSFDKLPPVLQRDIVAVDALIKKLLGVPGVVPHVNRLRVELQGIASIGRGILGLADAFGSVGQSVKNAINDAVNLAEAVVRVGEAQKAVRDAQASGNSGEALLGKFSEVASVFSAVGAAAGLVGALFAKHVDTSGSGDVLKQNTQALRDLTLRLAGFETTAANSAAAAGAAAAIAAAQGQSSFGFPAAPGEIPGSFRGLDVQVAAIQPILSQFGLTFDQFAQIAKDAGITLFDKNGGIVPTAFGKVALALDAFAKAALHFASGFDGQKTTAELLDNLQGKTSSQDTINRDVALLRSLAPGLGITALDPTALRAQLVDLIQRIAAGTLTKDQLGPNLKDVAQLTGVIQEVTGALNSLASSAQDAADATRNIPTGFRLAAAEFAAQNARTGFDTIQAVTGVGGPQSPSPVPTVPATVTPAGTLLTGDVTIVVQGAGDPRTVAREVLGVFRDVSRAQRGDATQWPAIQAV